MAAATALVKQVRVQTMPARHAGARSGLLERAAWCRRSLLARRHETAWRRLSVERQAAPVPFARPELRDHSAHSHAGSTRFDWSLDYRARLARQYVLMRC